MTELLGREWKSHFRSPVGWVMTAGFLMVAGVTASVMNLFGGSADLSDLFANLPYAAILFFPILTERALTAERRDGRDRLWQSLSVNPIGYVIGKYLGMGLLFLVQVAVLCLYPLIFSGYGAVSLAASYTALFGYLLFGMALLAVCSFFALQFRGRIASVVCNGIVCLGGSYAFFLTGLTEMNRVTGFLGPVLLFAGLGALIWFGTRKRLVALLVSGIPAAILLILLFAAPQVLTVWLPAFFNRLSPFSELTGFLGGHFDLPATVLLLSLTALFLLFSVLTVRRQWGIRSGYRGAAILAGGVILANLLCLFLPYTAAHPSVTGDKSFFLSEEARTALEKVEEDVTVYYLSAGGETDVDADLYFFAEQIGACSSHITVRCYNLTGTRGVAGYSAEELRAANQGFLVVSGEKSVLLGNDALYGYALYGYRFTPAEYRELLDSLTGEEEEEAMREAFRQEVSVFFRGEGLLAGAIRYVTDPAAPTVAIYTGTGSAEPDAWLADELNKRGCSVCRVDSLTELNGEAAVLLTLKQDLPESEAEALRICLQSGTGLLLQTASSNTDLPRLAQVLAAYGLSASAERNLILEDVEDAMNNGSSRFTAAYTDPVHPIVAGRIQKFLFSDPHEILLSETEGVEQTVLYGTSDQAYRASMTDITQGRFSIAVAAEKGTARVVWFATQSEDILNTLSGNANDEVLCASVGWITGYETGGTTGSDREIPVPILSVSRGKATFWSILLIGAVPLAILGFGMINLYRREKI